MGLLSGKFLRDVAIGAGEAYLDQRQRARDNIIEYQERALNKYNNLQSKYDEGYKSRQQKAKSFKLLATNLGSSYLPVLNTFAQQIAPFGEAALGALNIGEYISRVGASLGVDMKGLIKSQEQLAQEQQEAQQQALQEQVAPTVAKEGMGMVRDSAKKAQEQEAKQQEQEMERS